MPILSVIIPVYNSQEYLRECLDSILNQTFDDYEIICINDGSSDNSYEILKEYENKDKRVVVYNQTNKGASTARNLGMANSNGKYITFMDSDDCIEKDTYEKALKYIDDVDVVCFGIKTFGEHFSDITRKSDDNYFTLKYKGKHLLNENIILKTDCSVCNKIFKKSIIKQYSISFPDGLHYEDSEFLWKYILSSQNIYFLNEYFYKYRRHPGSVMHATFGNCDYAIEQLLVMENLYNYLKSNGKYDSNRQLFLKLFKNSFIFSYVYSTETSKKNVLDKAVDYANRFFISAGVKNSFINSLLDRNLQWLFEPKLSFFEQIFSLKNIPAPNLKCKYKQVCILGIKFRLRINK